MGPEFKDYAMRLGRDITRLLRNEAGTTAVEYGLIVSLIVIAILTAISQLASETIQFWDFVENEVRTAKDQDGGG